MTFTDHLLTHQPLPLALPGLEQHCREELAQAEARMTEALVKAEELLQDHIEPGAKMHLDYALNQLLRAQQLQALLPELQPLPLQQEIKPLVTSSDEHVPACPPSETRKMLAEINQRIAALETKWNSPDTPRINTISDESTPPQKPPVVPHPNPYPGNPALRDYLESSRSIQQDLYSLRRRVGQAKERKH